MAGASHTTSARSSPAEATESNAGTEEPDVLAVCDFSANLGKIERHIGPLAEIADPTMVCITGDEEVDGVDYRTVPDLGWRPVGLCLMFLAALLEARRNDYDAVVSFSLVPHGCFAQVAARLAGLPVHLGIIGEDLDVHAEAWYGPAIAALFRRFDAVSVPGRTHRRRLVELGVHPDRTAILSNPIDADRFRPDDTAPEYDLLWVGRFSPEKDPVRFVDACAALDDRGVAFSAAMVGDGSLRSAVETRIGEAGLAGSIDLAGWVDDPLDWYRRARIFVLTSRRDALPLTLVEAMATGCVPVVPDVGNVTDAAADGENAVVLADRDPPRYADAFESLLDDPDRLGRLGEAATSVRERYSYEAATEDWRSILDRLDGSTAGPRPARRIAVEGP